MEISIVSDIESPYTLLANSMRDQLDSLPPTPPSVCTIYRVYERLRLVNEKAYTPQVVSIGPFHHGKDSLKAMEEQKKKYLREYVERTDESLENYIKIIKEKEQELRGTYAETIGFSTDEFVKMILVDSAFIIEVLLRFNIPEFRDKHDPIFNKPYMVLDVGPDLFLLENQLPLFILEALYKPDKITLSSGCTLTTSIIQLFNDFFINRMELEGTEENLEKMNLNNVVHFVDFMRNLFIPSSPRDGGKCKSITAPSMTELHSAGVKFRVASSKNLFDIDFNNGILEIPKLRISNKMHRIFRNLLAFEQCHCETNYLNDYVSIMDCLVNIPEDVDLLVKKGIVENKLGDSREAATLINKLADGAIHRVDFYFTGICECLKVYCENPWHKWKANLKQNYFNTPWAIVSVIAAILLVILTIIQGVCSILQVENRTI